MEAPPVQPPPEVEYCPRCGCTLKEGWCGKCSRIRQLLLGVALWMTLPLAGFWSCLTNFSLYAADPDQAFRATLGMYVFFGSFAVGFVLFLCLFTFFIKDMK